MHISQGDSLGVFQSSFGWFWSFWAKYSKSSNSLIYIYNNFLIRVAKALIINKLIAIFYPRDRKS